MNGNNASTAKPIDLALDARDALHRRLGWTGWSGLALTVLACGVLLGIGLPAREQAMELLSKPRPTHAQSTGAATPTVTHNGEEALHLTSHATLSGVYAAILEKAASCKLTIERVDYRTVDQREDLSAPHSTASFNARGTYGAARKFLNELAEFGPAAAVTGISLEADPAAPMSPVLKIRMDVRLYLEANR